MPDDQNPQAIDLSSGLVPKQTPAPAAGGIDLSAGLVPKQSAAPHKETVGDAITDTAKLALNPTETAKMFIPGAADFEKKHPVLTSVLASTPEMVAGVQKELGKTVRGGAELVNKVLPKSMQIPTGSPEALESTNMAQTAGGLGENVAEFAMGDEALKGISWLDSLAKSPRMLEIMEKYPKTAKLIMGMAKGAGMGGAQGAVKAAGEGKSATEGAKEGAEGGAIGAGAGEVLGSVAKPLGKAVGLGTSAEEDIMRAAQPGKRNTRFLEYWKDAAPYIRQEVEEGGKFENFGEAADRIRDVRQKLWTEQIEPKITAHANEDIFANLQPGQTNPVKQAVLDNIHPSQKVQNFTGEKVKAIQEFSKKFDGPLTVEEGNALLEQFNAELDNAGYWKKNAAEKAAAEKADPFIANRVAATEALREQLYQHLENAGEKDIQQLKKTYGAIKNVEGEIRGQTNVAGRHRPMSLKQVIGITSGIAHGGPLGVAAAAVPILDRIYNSPEALLNRAVAKTTPAGPIRKTIAAGVDSLLHGNIAAAGGRWIAMQDGQGNQYEIHPEDVPEAQKRDPSLKPVDNQPQ